MAAQNIQMLHEAAVRLNFKVITMAVWESFEIPCTVPRLSYVHGFGLIIVTKNIRNLNGEQSVLPITFNLNFKLVNLLQLTVARKMANTEKWDLWQVMVISLNCQYTSFH